MPFLEGPRKRAAVEKKLRIDHSDVHLENEKLAEALSSNLDQLARRHHRQVVNRDHEIRQLRTSLSSMNVTPPTTAAPPQSTTTSTTTATVRRLKPAPTFVKLHVHVPGKNNYQESEKEDSNDDSSDEEMRRPTWWARSSPSKRTRGAWGEPSFKETEDMGNDGSGITKHQVKKITREQLILNNLDLNSVPTSWFTKVHRPSDVVPKRRRASSAQPSHRSTLPTSSSPSSTTPIPTPTPTRRSQRETSARPRPKRTKSAIPPTTAISLVTTPPPPAMEDGVPVSALFCGGLLRQKKTESTRSRRQLMEEMGKIQPEPAGGWVLDSSRLKFLTALRRERERLDMRVKMFLQSCDRVGEGGGGGGVSNRKAKELQSYVLPQALTS